ncbi:unnamed protein product [Rotaria magnacalcarata]|uniref:Cystinosin homolog n=1 Tax=Rotaria magnacalcarata TaxID=392030 RepID=A0A816QHP2_9BILA|nr:unnamed protein product [Rotaria magnacalcarata]CAF1683466.1 unnamed protein product [Rotaria magnacalcarata]CAF2061084.1 unnamed protein product [Rotaria magnacalcarata]CAF3745841.1 unnamed protein product [Rotaria magnacalcarata]CAF3780736.1 unnamed protein product [Rotaria magnacalcarata]
MNAKLLSTVIFILLLINRTTFADQSKSVIAFEPTYLSIAVGESHSVNVRILVPDIIPPDVFIEFLYDNQLKDTQDYINVLPNITFTQQTSIDQSRVIIIHALRNGHLVVTGQSPQINISSMYDFLLIDIARSNALNVLIQIVGWIYFVAWSISFYPQIILNFRRQSVIGLNFDFLALNLLGHSCYSIFNMCLYTSHDIQRQYYAKHSHGVLPVLLNDVLFSIHAVFACFITVGQCVFFERGKQRISYIARIIASILIVFLFISTIVAFTNHLSTLNLLYFYSYVKLVITTIKYLPQAWMNYKRKSTEGWSIGNILLDFTGGILSVLQMFLLAANYNDWSSIFGSPTKFTLGLFSVLFDIVFIVQHYILYRTNKFIVSRTSLSTSNADEYTPILRRQS